MHELSVAQNIIEIVSDYARENKAGKISEVVLDIGAVAGVIPETLEFAWEISVKNTLLENASLKINFIPAKALCLSCKMEFDFMVTSLSVLEIMAVITAMLMKNKINDAMRTPKIDANVYLRKLFIFVCIYA